MKSPAIPATYAQWQHCIVTECGIPLEKAFIEGRIQALERTHSEHTRQFIGIYGEAHYRQVLQWFRQAQADAEAGA